MRILLIGAAAIALSGCSWQGGSDYYPPNTAMPNAGYYGAGATECCEQTLSRWNLEAAIGPEYIVGGDAITGNDIHPQPGVSSPDLAMQDAYDNGMRYELGVSKALSPNQKLTLMGNYTKANGQDVTLGTIATPDAPINVVGTMGDYESYGLEAGFRQYMYPTSFPLVKSIRPYVEGRVGAAYVNDIALENAQIAGVAAGPAYNGGSVALYEGSWVPTGAGLVGVETPIFKQTTIGLETGIRYTGNMKSATQDLDGAALFAGANNGSSNWSVPVMLRGRYRF